MFPQRLLRASLGVAMLVCGALLKAEDSPGAPSAPAGSNVALQLAGAPIPQPPGAHTQHDLALHYLDWRKRRLLPVIQAAAKDQPWEADAIKFAEDTFALWAEPDGERSPQTVKECAARGDALAQAGCGELAIRYLTAHHKVTDAVSKKAVAQEYRRILNQLSKDPRYPRAFAWEVALNLRSVLPSTNNGLEGEILNLARQSVEEGSYDGADDVLFVDEILGASDFVANHSDPLEKLVTGAQKLPEWARETILGRIETNRGWRFRGGDWASKVTPEGWKGFEECLIKAMAHFEAAWKLKPDQPYAAREMIGVAMNGGSKEAVRLWFDRAVSARFDFAPAYHDYAWALRPRWEGSYEEMLAFGRACAATKRYDTDVPRCLIRVMDDIGSETPPRRNVYQIPEIADEVMAVDKGYVAAASPGDANIRRSELLLDAWLCRRWDEAKAALDKMPEQKLSPNLANRLREFSTNSNQVVGETLLYTGPAREDYVKAQDLEKQERYEEAAERLAAVVKASAGRPGAAEWVKRLTSVNDTRVEMKNGQWKDISPKVAEHSEWMFSANVRGTVPEDGVLQLVGVGESTITRWHRPLGENYEVRATIDCLSPPNKHHLFAIILGNSPSSPGDYVICQFATDQKGHGTMYIFHAFDSTEDRTFNAAMGMTNHLRVQCWHGRLNVYLNGERVCEKLKAGAGTPSAHDGEIGFGGYKLSGEEGFRVSHIAVRVLKAEPTPPEDGDDD